MFSFVQNRLGCEPVRIWLNEVLSEDSSLDWNFLEFLLFRSTHRKTPNRIDSVDRESHFPWIILWMPSNEFQSIQYKTGCFFNSLTQRVEVSDLCSYELHSMKFICMHKMNFMWRMRVAMVEKRSIRLCAYIKLASILTWTCPCASFTIRRWLRCMRLLQLPLEAFLSGGKRTLSYSKQSQWSHRCSL